MIDPDERLRRGAERILGRPITLAQEEAFQAYLGVLESWNRVHRLVGSSDRVWMVENLILDSLLFLRVIPEDFRSVLDIGSGAGIPGIPIKIVSPEVVLVMAESRRKRASFLSTAVRAIGLREASVYHGRAEAMVTQGVRFDAVVARCAGEPRAILEIGARLVADTGVVVMAGRPEGPDHALAERVRVVDPDTGLPRTFLVRHGQVG